MNQRAGLYKKLHIANNITKANDSLSKDNINDKLKKSTMNIKKITSKNLLSIYNTSIKSVNNLIAKPTSFSEYKNYLKLLSKNHFEKKTIDELKSSGKKLKLNNTIKLFKNMYKGHLKEEYITSCFNINITDPIIHINKICYCSGNNFKSYISKNYFDIHTLIVAYINKFKFNKQFFYD